MKYAFIMNSGTLDPESYSVLYDAGENQDYFTAVHGMDMTLTLTRKLAEEGYEQIDLCGDFDEEKTEKVRNAANGKIKTAYAKYSEEALAEFDALTSTDQYGIIVMESGMSRDLVRLELNSEEFNTHIAIAANEEAAIRAAKQMVEEGICFIELCAYFNTERAEKVKKAIDDKVPVGYCGEI